MEHWTGIINMAFNIADDSSIDLWRSEEGYLDPPGATWMENENAWQFVLYSKHASQVVLLLYDEKEFVKPVFEYRFDPLRNKSGPIWHCLVPEDKVSQAKYYAYRVSGPHDKANTWHNFDEEKILLDPYAKAVFFPPEFDRALACCPGPNDGHAPLGVIDCSSDLQTEPHPYPRHDCDLIIYEMHVRGFTRDPSSGVKKNERGTFAGIIEKIPYLVQLGVTAIELMPVFQFDPQEGNYWGYMPLNFFAPHHQYASSDNPSGQIEEFRQMVKALHDVDIEVILDVVYNHTCEGGKSGPNYSFKGIDSSLYYIQSNRDENEYADFSGCGNTLSANNALSRMLIIASLRYWRHEMHVDGFRFDLASIFARQSDGSVDDEHPPIFGQITTEKGFSNTRLIAEPWDAAGSYQLGREFPGWLWMQWNGKYRDALQQYVKGDGDLIARLMTRLYGSIDLFPDTIEYSCRPSQSINYITSHDGSSLYDMVSYEKKNNWANGHDNTDGCNEFRWNCGHEGDDMLPDKVLKLRKQQVKNLFCLLLLSNGTPMFRMGDEFLHTQGGNNNPYNQDNETSWLNWNSLENNQDTFRFVKMMIAFRKAHPSISRSHFWRDDVKWYDSTKEVDMTATSRTLAFCLHGASVRDDDLYVMINSDAEDIEFGIYDCTSNAWSVVVDTSKSSPDDILEPGKEITLTAEKYIVKARSMVVLLRMAD